MDLAAPLTPHWPVAAVAGAVGLVAMSRMGRAGRVMRAHGGRGIVAFEHARDWATANALMAAWGPEGRAAARTSLRWDLPFVLAYGVFLVNLAAAAAAEAQSRGWRAWASVATVAAVAFAVAAACDAVENAALLRVLDEDRNRDWPRHADRWARAKWALVYGAGVLLLVDAVALAARR